MPSSTAVPAARRIAIPVAVAVAIAVPALQATLGLGLSQRDFAADGNSTLRAAGYAFSIWSLIYAGLAAYAVWQALPARRETPVLKALGWPSLVAIFGCAAWIVAAAADAKWDTVVIILVSALAMISGLDKAARENPVGREFWLAYAPLALLAGWLTIAAAINILTVLTAFDLMTPAFATLAAFAGIGIVTALGVYIPLRTRRWPYAVPIAWGLVAVFVAERADKPVMAWTALAAATIVGTGGVMTLRWTARPGEGRNPGGGL